MCRRVLMLIFTVACAGCGDPPPTGYVSKADQFRVGFPTDPRVIDQPAGLTPARRYASRLYTAEAPNGAYTVHVIDIAGAADAVAAATDALLDEACADLVHAVGGTQTDGSAVALAGKYPGRTVTATTARPKAGVLRARVYLAGTRLYKVSVFGKDEFANSDAATAFLESFMVLE